jgi:hypothetical protein
MPILDMSPELLLLVATHLRQVDLLNVSLVCKQLHFVTEPELYREYSNPRIYTRTFLPFIRKLIERPELAKHVRSVDLHAWDMLDLFSPDLSNDRTATEFEDMRKRSLGSSDYQALTQAAKRAGVISKIHPYDPSSRLIDKAESMSSANADRDTSRPCKRTHLAALHKVVTESRADIAGLDYIFDDHLGFAQVSYDQKFCQLLRAGIEDAQAVLLFALLPNLQDIYVRGGPHEINALEWRASHRFAALRSLTVFGTDGVLTWPMAFFNTLLDTTTKLETLQVYAASSWYKDLDDPMPSPSNALALSLRPKSLSLVTSLVLQHCCLKASDLQGLFQACPGLKSFCYYHGDEQQGLQSPSPAEMLVLLEPFRNTLERLTLELELFNVEGMLDDEARFGSFAHMKALQFLDTSAEMWRALEDEDLYDPYEEDEVPNESTRLSRRLPSSLHTLAFHQSVEQVEPAILQIKDLIQMRNYVLPNLQELYIATENEEYIEDFSDVLRDWDTVIKGGPHPLNIELGPSMVMTVFDHMLPSRSLPDTKWFGNKYSTRFRKPNKMDLALKKMRHAVREAGVADDSYSIQDALADDPELAAALGPTYVEEPPVYYDTDEEEVDY